MHGKKYRFTGKDCYNLRCEYLHNGVCDSNDIKGKSNYTHFILTEGEYNSQSIATYSGFEDVPIIRGVTISIKELCLPICNSAEHLYNNFEDKSVFKDSHYEFRARP